MHEHPVAPVARWRSGCVSGTLFGLSREEVRTRVHAGFRASWS
jgi:hypothetical protein